MIINDPVPGCAVLLDLRMLQVAVLHALGLSDEAGAQPYRGKKNLQALPSGTGSRQDTIIHSTTRLNAHTLYGQPMNRRQTVVAW